MAKSIFVICDSKGNPFFTDQKGDDRYKMVWAYKNQDDAEASCNLNTEQVVEYYPRKQK